MVFAKNDDFYCKIDKDNWQVCRTCNETNEDCDGSSNKLTDKCRCEDIKLKDPYNPGSLIGGWETCQTEQWCFVKYQYPEGPSACSDQDDGWYTDDISPPDIWLKSDGYLGISKSKEACKGIKHNTGNENILEGVKIVGNQLKNIDLEGNLAEELKFYFGSSDDCKEECSKRIGKCGAWSFDVENFECQLHTVDSCCGQFGKRETDANFISGYVCRDCWSTKAGEDCPCSVEDRTKQIGTSHSSGASEPLHNSASGELSVSTIKLLPDLCKCENRLFKRRGRRPQCRCVKPVCSSDPSGSPPKDGKCPDNRRCRIRPLNETRFPLC